MTGCRKDWDSAPILRAANKRCLLQAAPVQLTRNVNRRIGRAMHDYAMLADGDQVLIAVSGGIDSLVLAWLLGGHET